jgi:hypothetical protein
MQSLTGRTLNGLTIPLTLCILVKRELDNGEIVFDCVVKYYANISGLIRVSDGRINSFNHIVTSILFGFKQNTLNNKPIVELIPNYIKIHSFEDLKIDINNEPPKYFSTPKEENIQVEFGKHKDGSLIQIIMKRIFRRSKDISVDYIWITKDPVIQHPFYQSEVTNFIFSYSKLKNYKFKLGKSLIIQKPTAAPPTVNQYLLQYEEDVLKLSRGKLGFVSLARR